MNDRPTDKYRPLSAWGYIGYQILFAIPLLGFILLIVFALDNSYIARRNYARSIFCLIILIVIVIALFIYFISGKMQGSLDGFKNIFYLFQTMTGK